MDMKKNSAAGLATPQIKRWLADDPVVLTGPNVHTIFFGIGMNYRKTANELTSCINDVVAMRRWWQNQVVSRCSSHSQYVILDEASGSYAPTRQGWKSAVRAVVAEAKAVEAKGKRCQIVLTYSGHGFFQRTTSTDEPDGRAECIVMQDGYVWDYEWSDEFVSALPESSSVFAFFDSCHSGTMLNLPATEVDPSGRLADTQQRVGGSGIAASVWMVSGCADDEASMAGLNRSELSAATSAVLRALSKNGQSWGGLMRSTRSMLSRESRNQHPLASASSRTMPPATLLFNR